MSGAKKGEQFSSFQIGTRPGFGPGSAPASGKISPPSTGDAAPAPPINHHFVTLAELLEYSDQEIGDFAKQMGETCAELDDLISKRSGRIKQEAQMARKAYEHAFSLIDYLFEVKAQLLSQQTPPQGDL